AEAHSQERPATRGVSGFSHAAARLRRLTHDRKAQTRAGELAGVISPVDAVNTNGRSASRKPGPRSRTLTQALDGPIPTDDHRNQLIRRKRCPTDAHLHDHQEVANSTSG